MPPEVPEIPLPTGMGEDARTYLESYGLVPIVPSIRSSDYGLALSDPFHYYLTRRLGLARALSWSEASSSGSWFHKVAELDDLLGPAPELPTYHTIVQARLTELTDICNSLGIVGDGRKSILDNELRSAAQARSFYLSSSTVPLPSLPRGWRSHLQEPYWRVVAKELRIEYRDPSFPETPLVILIDALLHHTGHNTLWLLDYKTTGFSPLARMISCPIEFQTQHYLHTTSSVLRSGHLHTLCPSLPTDIKLQGMMHIVVQRPTIKFGMTDRSYKDVPFTPSRGKNKGITRMEREYYGEPDFDLYLRRCSDWYQGLNDYAHEFKERASDPPVNISYSPLSIVLDEEGTLQYTSRLQYLHELATRDPLPRNFLKSSSLLTIGGEPTPFSDFSVVPVCHWPAIVKKKSLIVRHRDEETLHAHEEEVPQEEVQA